MNSGIRLGSIYGAPIVADVSAFVLGLLFGIAVFVDLERADVGSTGSNGLFAAIAGVVVLASVLVHELAHAVVAHRRGLDVRMIRIYVFGGYSVIDGVRSAGAEFVISAAGPVASLAIAGVCAIPGWLLGDGSALGRALLALALVNAAIAVFNLIPGFPLDGGRMLRGLLTSQGMDRVRATQVVTSVGSVVGYVLIGAGIVVLLRFGLLGLLVIAAGWFLASAAVAAGRREQLTAAFDGMTVKDAMRSTPEAISGRSTLSNVLDLYAVGPTLKTYPVDVGGRVVGVLGQPEIDAVAPPRWPSVRANTAMTPIGPDDIAQSDDPLDTLLLRPAGKARRVVVVEEGVVVGMIEGEDIAQLLPEIDGR